MLDLCEHPPLRKTWWVARLETGRDLRQEEGMRAGDFSVWPPRPLEPTSPSPPRCAHRDGDPHPPVDAWKETEEGGGRSSRRACTAVDRLDPRSGPVQAAASD